MQFSPIDEFTAPKKLSGRDKEKLFAFMKAFVGDLQPERGSGVIHASVSFDCKGGALKLGSYSTTDGYHDLHDSERSVQIAPHEGVPGGAIPFTEQLDEKSGKRYKTYALVKDCKEVYAADQAIWVKSMGAGFSSPAPGTATFFVLDPPGLKGWYRLDYTIWWD